MIANPSCRRAVGSKSNLHVLVIWKLQLIAIEADNASLRRRNEIRQVELDSAREAHARRRCCSLSFGCSGAYGSSKVKGVAQTRVKAMCMSLCSQATMSIVAGHQ